MVLLKSRDDCCIEIFAIPPTDKFVEISFFVVFVMLFEMGKTVDWRSWWGTGAVAICWAAGA